MFFMLNAEPQTRIRKKIFNHMISKKLKKYFSSPQTTFLLLQIKCLK